MPFSLNPRASKFLSYTDEILSTGYVCIIVLWSWILTSTSFPATPESNSLPPALQNQNMELPSVLGMSHWISCLGLSKRWCRILGNSRNSRARLFGFKFMFNYSLLVLFWTRSINSKFLSFSIWKMGLIIRWTSLGCCEDGMKLCM